MENAVLANRLKIGELAHLSGLSVKTIRYYEDIGLLAPTVERSSSGYRLFQSQVLNRLAFIKRAQSLGLSLQEIKPLLALHDRGELPCPEVKEQLQKKISEIASVMEALKTQQAELQSILKVWQEQPPSRQLNEFICPNLIK
jgi:DNA-binding transcriptional MerR regulator